MITPDRIDDVNVCSNDGICVLAQGIRFLDESCLEAASQAVVAGSVAAVASRLVPDTGNPLAWLKRMSKPVRQHYC